MKTTALAPDAIRLLQGAVDALQLRRPGEARRLLTPLIQAQPRLAEARRLNAVAWQSEGDLEAAEAEFRAAVAADKRLPLAQAGLADVLARRGQAVEAERAYRAALALDRRLATAALGLSNLLMAQGRGLEAIQATTPLAVAPGAGEALLTAHATALKALGRTEEALGFNERAIAAAPASAVAEHNLAATLGDLVRPAETEAATARAFAKGGAAPETWIVRARALLQLDRFDESEAAYREAIRRRPAYADAHRELAQLVWMRTEDAGAATAALDAALRAMPDSATLRVHKARVLEYAGDFGGAYDGLLEGLVQSPGSADLEVAAVHMAVLAGAPEAAVAHAERASALAPGERPPTLALCEAALAIGDAERAAAATERLLQATPLDQYVIALQATAWRLLGDGRYQALYDYDAFVRSHRLETPDGWPSLDAYLADLTEALGRRHPFKTHPLDQSLRHGSQASNLGVADDPAIRAFSQAVGGAIDRHVAALGRGRDPVRSRGGRGWRYQGVWSVRLRPEGFHTDHVHPQGWLSSACYVALPRATAGSAGREGWIKFGEPGVATLPKLAAERFVQPEPGMLVLFPSYIWHGTVPFSGDDHRLSIAFDLVPGA